MRRTKLKKPLLLLLLFLMSVLCVTSAGADVVTPEKTAKSITLFKPEYECTRNYIYKNKTYPIDSNQRKDGEGLRMVLKNNPESQSLLNDYQNRTNSLLIPAYIGTLGVSTILAGIIYSSTLSNHLGQRDTRNVTVASGITLLVGGYFYGRYALNSKEKTLEKSIETYNKAAPEKERITFDLTPLFQGTGGKIQTIVPF